MEASEALVREEFGKKADDFPDGLATGFSLSILALFVIGSCYGFAKVIPSQFTTPGLGRLLTPYGDSSPMGLVWTFMGFSPVFTIFTGAAEALGG